MNFCPILPSPPLSFRFVSWTLESICRAIISLLDVPDASSPLNCDAGNLIRAGDMTGFNNLARMYTIEYASKTIPQRTEKK